MSKNQWENRNGENRFDKPFDGLRVVSVVEPFKVPSLPRKKPALQRVGSERMVPAPLLISPIVISP